MLSRTRHRVRPSAATLLACADMPRALRCRARGWARLGAAQLCLGHLRASLSAYRRGLQLDPGNTEMQLGVQLAQAAAAAGPADRRRAMHHA